MQQAISKIQIESFLVGLGVGIVGSYVVYKTLTPKRFKWESVWSMKLWKKTDLSEKEIDRMIEFFFAEPGVYLPYPEGPIVCNVVCTGASRFVTGIVGICCPMCVAL